MEDSPKSYIIKGKLTEIEDTMGVVYIPEYDLSIKWPIQELPDVIEIGDTVTLTLNYPNEAEKIKALYKNVVKEEKYEDIRHLLEDLVN
jgi:hypothetical protein